MLINRWVKEKMDRRIGRGEEQTRVTCRWSDQANVLMLNYFDAGKMGRCSDWNKSDRNPTVM